MTDIAVTGAEAPEGPTYAPLKFDAAEFMHFVKDENLTEAQATVLLEEIWKIVVAFVDLRFGLHPVQHVLDKSMPADLGLVAESSEGVGSRDQYRTTMHAAPATPIELQR